MKKIVNSIFGLTVFAVMAVPVFATTDISNFSWTMDYRIVDGEKNGQIHTLHDGTIQLDGNIMTVSQDSGWTPTPTSVKIAVWEQDGALSADDLVGTIDVQPSSTLGGSSTFSKNFGWFTADGGSDLNGEYYLYLEKSHDDNWNLSGSGSLKSTY
ncbi:hypothetical protein [Paenibacillus popilliae]|uniref:Ethanolamine utilization protein n=1 Tax=Paenibacillus popilliae ATCC 14706 TaxID=1212764 RepID=M9M170_PAEPP|nr:hypothetical protein [Paenibacillus popilliae]GAC42619.1 ethanolamine utilization protein [Paenibacillus popilliae ATCC 14706]